MRSGPAFVDLGHPVMRLAERMVGITTARPVTQRHCGRYAALAGVDMTGVVGGEQAQVQHIDLDVGLLDHVAGDLQQPKRLGYLAGAGAVIAR